MLKIVSTMTLLIMLTCNAIAAPDSQANAVRCFGDYASEPVAAVRQGNDLCQEELAVLQARSSRSHTTLQNFMGVPLSPDNIPSIGVACSGGGLRAAIAALGLLRGLAKIGLLDAVSYAAGTSGSTWTLASWFVHDKRFASSNANLDQLTDYLRPRMANTLSSTVVDKEAMVQALLAKLKKFQPFSLNDIWGSWLAGGFFGKGNGNEHNLYLADIAPNTSDGRMPIPLFTAAIGQTAPCYQWAEFSPFEIGSEYLNTWISPSAFGKEFNAGVSFDKSDTQNFGYLLGLFGSLYAASSTDIIQTIRQDLEVEYKKAFLLSFLSWLPWINNLRISPPDVYNFSQNLPNSPLADNDYLTFVDAGFAFGLPFPPLLRRNIQVYIVCDATSDVLSEIGNTMHPVQSYARDHNYPFPSIDYRTITKQKISVFAEPENPAAPVVIYIPNFDSFSTLKTSYTPKEFDEVMLGIERAITDNVATIKQALALKIVPNSRPLLTSLPA